MHRRRFLGILVSGVAALVARPVLRTHAIFEGTIRQPQTWYVNGSLRVGGDGLSLQSPFTTLKKAMDRAEAGDTIYVAYAHVETAHISLVRHGEITLTNCQMGV